MDTEKTGMTLMDAIREVATGRTIISCIGKRYSPSMLAPVGIYRNYVAYASAGMTVEEQKGVWEVCH